MSWVLFEKFPKWYFESENIGKIFHEIRVEKNEKKFEIYFKKI